MKIITENTAKYAGGNTVNERWYNLVSNKTVHADNRTGDEIAADIIKNAGLEII